MTCFLAWTIGLRLTQCLYHYLLSAHRELDRGDSKGFAASRIYAGGQWSGRRINFATGGAATLLRHVSGPACGSLDRPFRPLQPIRNDNIGGWKIEGGG